MESNIILVPEMESNMLFVLRAGTCCYMALIADVWRSPFDHEGSDSEYASVDEESGADDDSSRNAADAHGLTVENIWNGRIVVDQVKVDLFEKDVELVILQRESMSYMITTSLDEKPSDERRLVHASALRIADVLTPRHQAVSRSQRVFELRRISCPLCLTAFTFSFGASNHLATEQHLLQVQRHHEQRGWVKAVPILMAKFPTSITPSSIDRARRHRSRYSRSRSPVSPSGSCSDAGGV